MKLNEDRGHWNITIEELRQMLIKQYGTPDGSYDQTRDFIVNKTCVFQVKNYYVYTFTLKGSPPKGYAVYITALEKLYIFDVNGNIKTRKNVLLTDGDSILNGETILKYNR